MQQTTIISLTTLILFLVGLVSVPVLAQPTTGENFDIYLYGPKAGNKQHRYVLDVTPKGGIPETYMFAVKKYELSYKYAGQIRWRHYPTFPHGEGKIVAMPGTGRMNITGWLGANIAEGKFFGLLSDWNLPMNATKYWIIAKEQNPRQVIYGTYEVN